MHIIEVTKRYRNDFHFVAYCRHCRMKSSHGDGYANKHYQQVVFPHRHCEHCGCDENGKTFEQAHATEGAQGGGNG